ncbi:parathyroid hormone/parathyroid hormone-related peptide receptor-like [Lycorma delicatula]|uniref:parathyroid hormone/parathyroid hormone-related peptide receptor-like n=1 Tax=Lycorma delicatula TaxID=130591 RepID=UPI003F515348
MGVLDRTDLLDLDVIKEAETKCRLNRSELNDSERFQQSSSDGTNLWCPQAWDGLLCWPATQAGGLVSLPCPEYFRDFDPQRTATRKCLDDGEWYWREGSNSTWTNYTQCFADKIPLVFPTPPSVLARYIPIVKTVSQIGYSVSLITLIVAFSILATFKGLRCPRNKLHMHLFLSFMFRACTTLFKDVGTASMPSKLTIAPSAGGMVLVHQHAEDWASCRAVTSLWQYFLLANYCWILMEGLYLHNLIFLALFTDSSSIALYIILGWGLPALFVMPWVFIRATWENTLCWTTNSNQYYFLLIKGPTTASILINFALFINIVRVLLSKLQASIYEENKKFRKWAKSTLVLVPLFGVHYAIFIGMSYVEGNPELEVAWLFGDQLFASFQGFFVAVLYCFLNGEVRTELKKKWRHWYQSPYSRRNAGDNYNIQTAVMSCLQLLYPGSKQRFNNVHGLQSYGKNESGVGADSCVTSTVVSIQIPMPKVDKCISNANQIGVQLNTGTMALNCDEVKSSKSVPQCIAPSDIEP